MKEDILKKIKKFGQWELHHRAFAFLSIIIATIIFTRCLMLFMDPNPTIIGFEVHHFDYGLFLLMIIALLVVLKQPFGPVLFTLTSISFGLILDELWYIRSNVNFSISSETAYQQSLAGAIILTIIIVAAVVIINKRLKR